ncbi:MAG: glycosyltransferase [Nitrospirota bacterium]|nr:glycosyltransferase [Nitrospirota bacterium]
MVWLYLKNKKVYRKAENAIDPKVSIILLNRNGKEDTIECLESLKHITCPNYEILLVDNGSTDGSVECLREVSGDYRLK